MKIFFMVLFMSSNLFAIDFEINSSRNDGIPCFPSPASAGTTCSIQEVIRYMNANPAPGDDLNINFSVSNIVLDAPVSFVQYDNTITLQGNGVTISSADTFNRACFTFAQIPSVKIENFIFRDCDSFIPNVPVINRGGAILFTDIDLVQIFDSTFNSNRAPHGGAIGVINTNFLYIRDSEFFGNNSLRNNPDPGLTAFISGGALFMNNVEFFYLADSFFQFNTGTQGASAIAGDARYVQVTDSSFINNSGNGSGFDQLLNSINIIRADILRFDNVTISQNMGGVNFAGADMKFTLLNYIDNEVVESHVSRHFNVASIGKTIFLASLFTENEGGGLISHRGETWSSEPHLVLISTDIHNNISTEFHDNYAVSSIDSNVSTLFSSIKNNMMGGLFHDSTVLPFFGIYPKKVKVNKTEIARNNSWFGPGIRAHLGESSQIEVKNSSIHNNTSELGASGIHITVPHNDDHFVHENRPFVRANIENSTLYNNDVNRVEYCSPDFDISPLQRCAGNLYIEAEDTQTNLILNYVTISQGEEPIIRVWGGLTVFINSSIFDGPCRWPEGVQFLTEGASYTRLRTCIADATAGEMIFLSNFGLGNFVENTRPISPLTNNWPPYIKLLENSPMVDSHSVNRRPRPLRPNARWETIGTSRGATDQIGTIRPQGRSFDSGAIESF